MAVTNILFRSWIASVLIALAVDASALDYITARQAESQQELVGKIEVEAVDGGVLLLTADGVLWPIPKEEIVSRRSDDKPFVPLRIEALTKQLTTEFPGFKVHKTQHYLIAYNTSQAYARWVGSLFERLHSAFYTYWKARGASLHESQFPLIGVVFNNQESYALHSRKELGEATGSIIGYYSLRSNRVMTYDLTGIAELSGPADRAAARINQILSQPGAERTVATIVHEATHQLAFNSGLQVRYADIPFWVSEGIAIYFETPDLESAKGWRNIGGVNPVNLVNFRKASANASLVSLERL